MKTTNSLNNAPKVQKTRRTARRTQTHFNLMVAGHSGTGKSSFISTMHATMSVRKLHYDDDAEKHGEWLPLHPINTPSMAPCRVEFDDYPDSSGRIIARFVDTPGISIPTCLAHTSNDKIDPAKVDAIFVPYMNMMTEFFHTQFEATLLEESRVKRNPKAPDHMMHALVYFLDANIILAAQGQTLVDVKILSFLATQINVIPVIGKSDVMTVRELKHIQEWVKRDLEDYKIPVYDFIDDELDSSENQDVYQFSTGTPFTIINSETIELPGRLPEVGIPVEGETVLGREYLSGICLIDYSDFYELKDALFNIFTHDLRETTREIFYEKWRTAKLLEVRDSFLNSYNEQLTPQFSVASPPMNASFASPRALYKEIVS